MLTDAQRQTLKTFINGDSNINTLPNTDGGAQDIANYLNAAATPAYRVWRTAVPTSDVKKAVVWTEFIARSDNEQRAFQFMLSNGIINAADLNIRQGIADCFSGPNGAATRAALLAIAKRDASRLEKLFASGGVGSEGDPATMVVEGVISYQEVFQVRNN